MPIDAATILTLMGVPSAVTGLCFWAIKNSITRRDQRRDKLDAAREQNQILLIRSVGAAIALGEATAYAIRDGKTNGEMTAALQYAQNVKHDQRNFMTEQGIKNII